MTAIGLFLMYLGYCVVYWAWEGISGKSQDSFLSYLIPSGSNGKGGGSNAAATTPKKSTSKTVPAKPQQKNG